VKVVRADGSHETLLKGETRVAAGDRVLLFTAGGGGFGDPKARDAQAVSRDVSQGYVSAETANAAYGYLDKQ
jgi:N-methylhydantoinase B/oxoprolinase/acetone carboxylase alpha subunit